MAYGGMRPVRGRTHALIEHVLDLSGKPRPRVCFLPTATGDHPNAVLLFYDRVPDARAARSHLLLFDRTVADLRSFLLAQDVIWVSGGNTANLLAVFRVHGVDAILREAWEAGIVLCGGSAGSLCWFECGTTDSFNLAKLEALHDGLGFLPGSHCPHYDGEPQRRPTYHALIAGGFPPGIAVDDDAAAHFVGTQLREVVTAREGATAYRMELRDGVVVETPLPARLLP